MTFLPIVERELRVASRRRGTYWMRFYAALIALGMFLLISSTNIPGTLKATITFRILAGLMLGICLLTGVFSTADCLSSEKRDGTMGLLFLTDLRGYDVILGKLTASSLNGFYALLSMLPILALPLMMGGVAVAEFWRMVVVLVVSLFLSLGVGMFISSVTRESRPAVVLTLLSMIILTLLVPMAVGILVFNFPWLRSETWMFWTSPAYAFGCATDNVYTSGLGRHEFLGALTTIFSIGLVCLVLSSLILPRAWQEKQVGGASRKGRGWWKRLRFGAAYGRQIVRTRLLDVNPFIWLMARDRMPQLMMWIILGLASPFWIFLTCKMLTSPRSIAFGFVPALMMICCGVNLAFKFVMASEASRRLNEDRQSGALELLLVTPVNIPGILSGQRRALLRQFRFFLLISLVMLGVLLCLFENFRPNSNGADANIFAILVFGNMIGLVSDFLALGWLGMWDGLRARQHHRAILRSLAKVLLIPWILWVVLMAMFTSARPGPGAFESMFVLWFIICVVNNLFWSMRARRGLLGYFRLLVSDAATGVSRARAPNLSIKPVP